MRFQVGAQTRAMVKLNFQERRANLRPVQIYRRAIIARPFGYFLSDRDAQIEQRVADVNVASVTADIVVCLVAQFILRCQRENNRRFSATWKLKE